MNQRTLKQNNSLHKFFELLSEELNNAGYDVRTTLRHDLKHPWTPELIKDLLWRPVQIAVIGKKSTASLDTKEPDHVYEILNKHLGERLAIHVPFPKDEPPMEDI